jgi:CheY-like chemotaxis protein
LTLYGLSVRIIIDAVFIKNPRFGQKIMNMENEEMPEKETTEKPAEKAYLSCSCCGAIVIDDVSTLSAEGENTLCCGARAESRAVWPRLSIQKFISLSKEQDLNSQQSRELALLSLCTAVQFLMEEAACRILDIYSENNNFEKVVLNENASVSQQIKLYNRLSDVPLEGLLAPKGFHGFLKALDILTDIKNSVVRNSDNNYSLETELMKYIQAQFLDVFVLINNDIARQSQKTRKKAKTDKKIKKFLIVDDEKDTLEYLSKIIRRHGHETLTAENGAQAMEIYSMNRPDGVFLDVMLGDTDGTSVLKDMMKIDSNVNVYFVTGLDGAAFQKQAIEEGARGIISKPINLHDVLRILTTL